MLQKINQYTSGWVAGIIVSLIAITFMFWGVANYTQTRVDTSVAKVNDVEISKAAFRRTIEQMRAEFANRVGADKLTAAIDQTIRKQALQTLLTREVMKQNALQKGYYFSTQQTEQAASLSLKTFLSELQTNHLLDQLSSGFTTTTFILPQEVDDSIRLIEQARDFNYLVVPNKKFAEEIKVAIDEIKTYYDQHQNNFKTPEKVSIEYLQLSLDDLQ